MKMENSKHNKEIFFQVYVQVEYWKSHTFPTQSTKMEISISTQER